MYLPKYLYTSLTEAPERVLEKSDNLPQTTQQKPEAAYELGLAGSETASLKQHFSKKLP